MKIIEITYRYDGTDATIRPRPSDAESARARLDDGSRSIRALLDSLTEGTGTARRVIPVDPRDLGLASGAPKQRPYAAVLGCSDARVPIELIFNEGPNDLFVVRVAGNGLGRRRPRQPQVRSRQLGGSLKIIVVLGHSGCGAVSAAVDAFLDPKDLTCRSPRSTLCAASSTACSSWSMPRPCA
jgi:carbonic anhydrase